MPAIPVEKIVEQANDGIGNADEESCHQRLDKGKGRGEVIGIV